MTQTQPETDLQPFRTESRTFTWATPGQADPRQVVTLDGIGQLRAMAAGELPAPPIMATLGFTDFRPEPGRVVVAMTAGLVPFGAMVLMKWVFYAYEDGRTVFLLQVPIFATLVLGSVTSMVLLAYTNTRA